MADNTTLNAGSGGDVIASDDIGGVKFQRVKLIHGADGTNAGDVATANPLPVISAPVAGTSYVPSAPITDFGTATKGSPAAGAKHVLAIYVSNANAAARWFQLHNKNSAPAAAEVPIYSFYVPAGAVVSLGTAFFGENGTRLATGLGWAWSTTVATFTDSATASDHSTLIQVI